MKRLTTCMIAGALASMVAVSPTRALTLDDPQNATIWSTADLGSLCSVKPDGGLNTAALNMCHGFARGAIATYLALQLPSRRPLRLFCLPNSGVGANTTLEEFGTWAKANPAHDKEMAVDGLFRFLGTKFPCPK